MLIKSKLGDGQQLTDFARKPGRNRTVVAA
jgi:hypothetical protein